MVQALVSRILSLEEKAESHMKAYAALLREPQKYRKAQSHYKKAQRFRSQINELIKQVAAQA